MWYWLISNIEVIQQIDGRLPDGEAIRIMQSSDGFHVSVGTHRALPPMAVRADEVLREILRQWLGV